MDGARKKLPGAEALGDFDVSDLKVRDAAGDVRALIPHPLGDAELIPQQPPAPPPPWWQNFKQQAEQNIPSAPAASAPGAQWAQQHLPPSGVRWWYREKFDTLPNTAQTRMQVRDTYTVPPGQALALFNIIPTAWTVSAISAVTEISSPALSFLASFRCVVAGHAAIDSEHVGAAPLGTTNNLWDTGVFNLPMFWGNASIPVPYAVYVKENESLQFEFIASNGFAGVYTALGGPTGILVGYRSIGFLMPMSYLF